MPETSSATGAEAKVAIHCSFARSGADWAFHPALGKHKTELLRALHTRLNSPETGDFEIAALGGVLVGEKVEHLDCPDPLARERQPTVLRVALLPHHLLPGQREELLGTLRKLPLPQRPGEDPKLSIPVPVWAPPPQPRLRPAVPVPDGHAGLGGRRIVLLAGAFCLLLGLLGVSLLALGPRRKGGEPAGALPSAPAPSLPQPSTGPFSAHSPARPAQGAFRYDDDELPGLLQPGKFEEILKASATTGLDHPYVRFLKDQSGRLRRGNANSRLQDKVMRLQAAPEGERRDLLQQVKQEMSYESWRRSTAGKGPFADADHLLPSDVIKLVECFRLFEQLDKGLQETVLRMAELLRRWGKDWSSDQAKKRPFRVIDAFFATLKRPDDVPPPWGRDDLPETAFLWRLPPENLASGRTFDTGEELRQPLALLLCHLTDRVDSATAGLPAAQLLEKIEAELDYASWEKGHKVGASGIPHDLPPEVREYVQQFKGNGMIRRDER